MKTHYIFFSILFVLLLSTSCIRRTHYLFPQKKFGISIPITVPSYYDIDTVDCGFGTCPENTLVVQVTPDQFSKYLGHLKFVPIDASMIHHDTVKDMDVLKLHKFKVDSISNSPRIQATNGFHRERIHYDFDFRNGKICLFNGSIWQVILYDPQTGILIFDSFY